MEKITDAHRLARMRTAFISWLGCCRWRLSRTPDAAEVLDMVYRWELDMHACAIECGPTYARMFETLLHDAAFKLAGVAEVGVLWPSVIQVMDAVDEDRAHVGGMIGRTAGDALFGTEDDL